MRQEPGLPAVVPRVSGPWRAPSWKRTKEKMSFSLALLFSHWPFPGSCCSASKEHFSPNASRGLTAWSAFTPPSLTPKTTLSQVVYSGLPTGQGGSTQVCRSTKAKGHYLTDGTSPPPTIPKLSSTVSSPPQSRSHEHWNNILIPAPSPCNHTPRRPPPGTGFPGVVWFCPMLWLPLGTCG